jgi:hypothetical protein
MGAEPNEMPTTRANTANSICENEFVVCEYIEERRKKKRKQKKASHCSPKKKEKKRKKEKEAPVYVYMFI